MSTRCLRMPDASSGCSTKIHPFPVPPCGNACPTRASSPSRGSCAATSRSSTGAAGSFSPQLRQRLERQGHVQRRANGQGVLVQGETRVVHRIDGAFGLVANAEPEETAGYPAGVEREILGTHDRGDLQHPVRTQELSGHVLRQAPAVAVVEEGRVAGAREV